MIGTLNHDAELPLTPQDCADYIKATIWEIEYGAHISGQRLGQFWMNQLALVDRRKLIYNWEYNPWERDDWLSIQRALMFLLEN